jgi:hypothetical protein
MSDHRNAANFLLALTLLRQNEVPEQYHLRKWSIYFDLWLVDYYTDYGSS